MAAIRKRMKGERMRGNWLIVARRKKRWEDLALMRLREREEAHITLVSRDMDADNQLRTAAV